MANLIPELNTSGTFEFESPFATQFVKEGIYTTVAIRRFADIVNAGGDVFKTHYEPFGIPETRYQQDSDAGVAIITLRSTSGRFQHVPSSYIKTFPIGGGIPYTAMVMGVNLGAIPDQLDLTLLTTRIQQLVQDTLGIPTPEVKLGAISPKTMVSQTQHADYEAARVQNIRERPTDAAKVVALESKVDQLTQENKALADYIQQHLPPTP